MTDSDTQTPPSERRPLLSPATAQQDVTPSRTSLHTIGTVMLMALLIFIQATNISMMTTAQSAIAADLDAYAETTWFTASFMIATSSVTPLVGRLSAIFTPRLCLVVSSTIFSLGLFITASAPSLAVFILGRAISGWGSGGLMSITIILVLDFGSSKRRGLLIGLISSGVTTGVASGAVLAGLLTPLVGWRVIFWVQAPSALVLGPLLYYAIPPSSSDRKQRDDSIISSLARIDYAGSVTLTIGIILFLTALASPEILIWPIPIALGVFAVFFVIESRWAHEPIIPVHILLDRGVLLSCLAGVGFMMARWAVVFFTPSYAIAVRGWPPASAGLILVPTNAGFGAGGLLVGWLHIRNASSYYTSCLVLFILFAISTATLSVLSSEDSPAALYMAMTFFNGLFAGALVNYSLSHLLFLTDKNMHFIVSALFTSFRGISGSFGSAIGGGFFTRVLKKSLEEGFSKQGITPNPDLVRTLLGSPATVSQLEGIEHLVAKQSYEHAFRMLFLAGCAIALGSTVIQAGTGWTAGDQKGNEDWETERNP
ncbi:hypothetical protein N7478_001928 [Penicillium angulare]|uniref:uncharacterized protein n=1 Tax=Penicillium angulare TaxID=116970 RepID=UPI0025413CD0|nr:uncharacterized protein N7478_001928 [Penicillium angulare]KAJ5288898.1 hypothetical protein N7478_001928 [Penicillium angulare]